MAKTERCNCAWCDWLRIRYPDLKNDPNPGHMGDEKEVKKDESSRAKQN